MANSLSHRSRRQAVAIALLGATIALALPSVATAAPQTVRRFYRSNGVHFWSVDPVECADMIDQLRGSYRYEGMTWTFDNATGGSPIYRAYNKLNGSNFYTAYKPEYDALPSHYKKEDVACRVRSGTRAVYRFHCPSRGYHFYTASTAERDQIIVGLPRFC